MTRIERKEFTLNFECKGNVFYTDKLVTFVFCDVKFLRNSVAESTLFG